MIRVSSIVTEEDLLTYFKGESFIEDDSGKFERWSTKHDKGVIEAKSPSLHVTVTPKRIEYSVQCRSVEDPSDEFSGKTEDPVKFIKDNLGSAYTEFLEKYKRKASVVSLRRLAALHIINRNKSIYKYDRIAHRIALKINAARGIPESTLSTYASLVAKMNDEGISSKYDDLNERITFYIGEKGRHLYEGTIFVSKILYELDLKIFVRGVAQGDDVNLKEITSDPIKTLETHVKELTS